MIRLSMRRELVYHRSNFTKQKINDFPRVDTRPPIGGIKHHRRPWLRTEPMGAEIFEGIHMHEFIRMGVELSHPGDEGRREYRHRDQQGVQTKSTMRKS